MQMGGAQKVALNLANRAIAQKLSCTIISLDSHNAFASTDSRASAKILHLGYNDGLSIRNIASIHRTRQRLRSLLEAIQPTVIHSHLFMSKAFLLGNVVPAHCAVVDTIHDNLPWWEQNDLRSLIMRTIDRRFHNKVASFSACISQAVQKQASTILETRTDRLPLIYNFVETPSAKMPKTPPANDKLRLLVISRLQITKKGLDTALEITNLLRESIPAVHLTILGDGPDRTKLEKLSFLMGVANHVTFAGQVQDVVPFLDETDFLLMPSRWEGFGLTAIEAGMRGVPVIASKVGGLAEVVLDNQTGRLCDPKDPHSFVRAITETFTSPSLYYAYSQQAVHLTKHRFSPEAAFSRYLELYHRSLSFASTKGRLKH
ncbi:glycosyltransferase family 4 protein [Rosistilla oblonga]|uniref:glycosyltransferase family 4 protein n=1 Tax=Rosistilla oblonga TaxID=2527990 RepID=UPI003A96E39D